MRAAIEQMRYAFEQMHAGAAINQPRRRLILPTGSVLHQMAGSCGPYFATKIYSSNVKHGGLHEMVVLLYDAETGKPLAYFEALNLSLIRTGAATGYAADLLADPSADVMGIIGSGLQARAQVEAIRTIRPIQEVRVWSRNPDHTQQFAAEYNCRPVESAEDAVRNMPIVVTATSAKDPVIEAAWLAKGAFVAAMGSNMANRRELPADLVRGAGAIYVDNMEQAALEAGDLIMANHWANVSELQEAVRGFDPESVTIFESLGIAVEDCAAAAYIYEQAHSRGLG